MRILDRLFGPSRRDLAWSESMRGVWTDPRGDSYTGKPVTLDSAMTNATFYAGVRVIAESIGMLPQVVYQELTPRGRAKAPDHPMYPVFHWQPNPEMTSAEFTEATFGHLVTRGNAFSNVVPLNNGGFRLWPLRPDKTRVTRRKDTGELAYIYELPSGEQRSLTRQEVWHNRGLSSDGVVGYSLLQLMGHALELGLAQEEYAARLFGNQSRPGGVLGTDKTLTKPAIERMKTQWEDLHRGLENSHRVAILEEGVKWQQVTLSPSDAQLIDARKYQRSDLAAFLRVPLHMLGDLERATFSNIEHQGLEFVTHTLMPWLNKYEQSAKVRFFGASSPFYMKFVLQALLRGDTASRYASYQIGRQGGWLCPDDIRELEDMNPIGPEKGGDTYLAPVNMIPLEKFREYGETLTTPPEPPPDPNQDDEEPDPPDDKKPTEKKSTGAGSAESRRRLASAHQGLFRDATSRLVKREVKDVKRLAERAFGSRDFIDFDDALGTYYRDLEAYAEQVFGPPVQALVGIIANDAASEAGLPAPDEVHLTQFGREYARTMAAGYIAKSLAQLRQVARLTTNGDPQIDPTAEIGQRLEEWDSKRANKVASRETAQLTNAVTRETWKRGGVRRIRWVASGARCAYCQRLNGRTVGIDQTFLSKGDSVTAEGHEPLTVRGHVHHPPAHGGCGCGLSPA